jgi:hypothetical protein
MFFKQPSLHIDKVENLEINTRLHPFWEEEFYHYLKARQRGRLLDGWPVVPMPQPPTEIKEKVWLKFLDYGGKIVSILSGIAVIAFVVLLWLGRTAIGSVQIGTLLTVISFTLVGGLISIGGVKMFSITANLRKAKEKIERSTAGCPFVPLFLGSDLKRPGNPNFCIKCPLGIDRSSNVEGGLIHVCTVYLPLHNQWKQLPGAEKLYRG